MAIATAPSHFGKDSTTFDNTLTLSQAGGDEWTQPTAGDILIVAVTTKHNSDTKQLGTVTGPTGFQLLSSYTAYGATPTSDAPAAFLYGKISDGTEVSFTWSCTGANITNIGMFAIAWSPTDLDTDINNWQVDINDTYFNSIQTELICGPITNAQPNALCLAFAHNESGSASWWEPDVWDNGFTEQATDDWAAAGVVYATKVVSSVASQQTGGTGNGTGTQLLGSMIVINEPNLTPVINSVTPDTFADGATDVVVAGSNFGSTQGSSTLDINGVVQTGLTWSDTSITIPTVDVSGVPDGPATLRIDKN